MALNVGENVHFLLRRRQVQHPVRTRCLPVAEGLLDGMVVRRVVIVVGVSLCHRRETNNQNEVV
jgi:hypothetical protein